MTKKYIIQMILAEVENPNTDEEVWDIQEEDTIDQDYTNFQDALKVYQGFVRAFQTMNNL